MTPGGDTPSNRSRHPTYHTLVDHHMNDPARRRVSQAITHRMTELGLTAADLAAKATIDPTTLRSVLRGDRWPRTATRQHLEAALGWPEDHINTVGNASLHDATCDELRHELHARCGCETGT